MTGGAGRVGAAVLRRLSGAGYDLTVIGRRKDARPAAGRYVPCDVADVETLVPLLRGVGAVVHLAALPSPGYPPQEVFQNNAAGSFALYEAAARAGVHRVVTASSINALGYNWGVRSFALSYLPLDEQHPLEATDAYSFSKQVTERIADYAWRRDGISGVCLRLPYVAAEVQSSREHVQKHAAACRASWEALLRLSADQRAEKAREWIAHRQAHMAARKAEGAGPGEPYVFPDPLTFLRTDFWTRIDERDSAQAIEKAIVGDYEGSHPLFVNDTHNVTGVPSLELARLFFPEAVLHEERLQGCSSLVSIDAARALLGFEPEHSVGRWL